MYATNDWDELFRGGLGYVADVYPLVNPGQATVVEIHERATDGYGEPLQGEDEIYIIFEVDGRFFKKTGSQGSYDENRSWDGSVREVFGSTKTITVFVPKGR